MATADQQWVGKHFFQPRGWKLVLSEYNSIRLRLYSSQALSEGTNLVLFNMCSPRIFTCILSDKIV